MPDVEKKHMNTIMGIIMVIIGIIIVIYMYTLFNNSKNVSYDSSYIITGSNITPPQETIITPKLDTGTYEIMKTPHSSAVQNFYVLIKFKDFSQDNLQDFADSFKDEFCTKDCNINLYDSKTILPLIDKYPLEGNDYIKVADHYIALLSFDSEYIWLYPFQDFLYKEYGGKNWKKEPIQ